MGAAHTTRPPLGVLSRQTSKGPVSRSAGAAKAAASQASSSKTPAHLPLHRRLLYPSEPVDAPLPQIIKAQGQVVEELNERVYHLLALALRAYVLSWYPRISPRDRTLLPAICSQALLPVLSPILTGIHDDPARLARLILLDLPAILSLHIETYWAARSAVELGLGADAFDTEGKESPDLAVAKAYNVRLPLLCITPAPPPAPDTRDPDAPYRSQPLEGQPILSSIYLTALADSLFRLHLPPKEYAPAAERTMAREILGRTVLESVGRKLGEGWFWWSLGLKFIGEPAEHDSSGRPAAGKREEDQAVLDSVLRVFQRLMTVITAMWSATVALMALYSAAPPTPPEYVGVTHSWVALCRDVLGIDGRHGRSERRWSARLAWGVVELVLALCSRYTDRLLPHLLLTHVLMPKTAFRLCDVAERVLFPLDGYPAPTPPDPMPAEAQAIRDRFEARLMELVPSPTKNVFFPTESDQKQTLDPLDNSGCNAHLVGTLLNAVVAALEPALEVSRPVANVEARAETPQFDHGDDARSEIGQDPAAEAEMDDAAAVRLAMETPLIDTVKRRQLRMQ